MQPIDSFVAQTDGMTAVRHDLHAHRALCFKEVRTATDMAITKLTEPGSHVYLGRDVRGVLDTVQSSSTACATGLHAYMDALSVTEFNTFAHASRPPGKMKACSHDGHIAMLLAAAQHLARHGDFDGAVYLILPPGRGK